MKPRLKWIEIEKGGQSLRRRKSSSLRRYPAKMRDACRLKEEEEIEKSTVHKNGVGTLVLYFSL